MSIIEKSNQRERLNHSPTVPTYAFLAIQPLAGRSQNLRYWVAFRNGPAAESDNFGREPLASQVSGGVRRRAFRAQLPRHGPTEKCRAVVPIIRKLLANFNDLTDTKTFAPADITRTLSIAAADNAVVMILRPVLRALLREAPQMNFRLLPLSENVFRELAEGSVDLALFPTSLGETLPEHFHGLKLFDIHRVCLLRKEHPLATSYAQGKKLTRKAFLKYPKIAVELRQNARGPVFDIDTSSTHDQRKIIEVPYFLGAPYFLEDTNATLVLPHTTAEFFARMLPTLTVIPIPGEKRVYSTRLIWHERNHASSEMQWIRSVFVSTLRKNASEENQTARSEDL